MTRTEWSDAGGVFGVTGVLSDVGVFGVIGGDTIGVDGHDGIGEIVVGVAGAAFIGVVYELFVELSTLKHGCPPP
eukprot:gene3348-4208_t